MDVQASQHRQFLQHHMKLLFAVQMGSVALTNPIEQLFAEAAREGSTACRAVQDALAMLRQQGTFILEHWFMSFVAHLNQVRAR